MDYLFLRHAETAVSDSREWHGPEDPPLSGTGRKHALEAAETLQDLGHPITTIITSDQCRAVETATVFDRVLNCGVVCDAQLRERDLGEWSGLTRCEIEERWPGYLEAWRTGRIAGPPGGETDKQVSKRLRGALFAHSNGSPMPKLIIAHAGLLRGLLASQGLPHDEIPPLSGRWLKLLPARQKIVIGEGASL
jgi:broad specificity phosphatase PhoE